MTTPDNNEGGFARDEVLAGEYVLGVLSLRDRLAVEARMKQDRAFADAVARWQENLSDFNEAYEPVTPPAGLFRAVEQQIFRGEAAAPQNGVLARLWTSIVLWRSTAIASLALLAAYVIATTTAWGPDEPTSPLVAQLSGENEPVTLFTQYDERSGRLQMTPVASDSPAQPRSLELWLVPGGNDPTISLGVLPQTGDGVVVVPPALRSRITEGATLAVSLEPFGGSPTGQATGPVIAVGQTRRP